MYDSVGAQIIARWRGEMVEVETETLWRRELEENSLPLSIIIQFRCYHPSCLRDVAICSFSSEETKIPERKCYRWLIALMMNYKGFN